MLEKFLKTEGVEKLTSKEQKNIIAGNNPPGICFDYYRGYYTC